MLISQLLYNYLIWILLASSSTCTLGLGDIEIQYYDYCQQRRCDYCYYCIKLFKWYLVSSTCVLSVTALKTLRIIDAYLLCVLNPIVLHCNMLQYSVIYCMSNITDLWKVCNIDYCIPLYYDIGNTLKYCPTLLYMCVSKTVKNTNKIS